MAARMNNSIHIKIQVVKLYLIWIWLRCVNWNFNSIDFLWLHMNNLQVELY